MRGSASLALRLGLTPLVVGLTVVGLKRVRIGRVKLGQLPVGQWRYLAAGEVF